MNLNPSTHIENYIAAFLRQGDINDEAANTLRGAVVPLFQQYDSERDAIAREADLSAAGKSRRLAALQAKTLGRFAETESLIKVLDTRIGEARARALKPRQQEHSVIDEMRHRELRDLARQQATRLGPNGHVVDQHRLDAIYRTAIESKNADLIAALEVPAFGLLSDDARKRGEDMKIEASDLAGEIRALERVRYAYATVLDSARRQLGEAPAVAAQ